MPLIIDTFNVLHTVGILPPELAGIDVQGLIALLAAGRYRDERITLVCDGLPQGIGDSLDDLGLSVSIRFAGPTKLADDLISQLITASSAPRRVIVVSSDHEIQRAARKRKCKAITSEEFLQHLADDRRLTDRSLPPPVSKPPPSSITPQQVDRWLSVFQLDEDTLAISAGAPLQALHDALDDDDESAQAKESAPPIEETVAPPSPSVIPESLIQQAERLWQQEVRPRSVAAASPPPASGPVPVKSQSSPPALPQPDPGNGSTPDPSIDDLSDLDMNAILPDDGKTKRWKPE